MTSGIRTGGYACCADVHVVLVHRGGVEQSLHLFWLGLLDLQNRGQDGGLCRVSRTCSVVHLAAAVDGMDGASLLTDEAVLRASLLIPRGERGGRQGGRGD